MRTRRGSAFWPDGLSDMMLRFQPGDLVVPVASQQDHFLGVVKEVLPKINKVMVLWNGGSLKQHDPDEIHLEPYQSELVRSRMAKTRRVRGSAAREFSANFQDEGVRVASLSPRNIICWLQAGNKVAAEKRIDILRRILSDHQAEKIDGYLVDSVTASTLVSVYDALEKLGSDAQAKFDRIPLTRLVDFGWSVTRSASVKGKEDDMSVPPPNCPYCRGEREWDRPGVARCHFCGRSERVKKSSDHSELRSRRAVGMAGLPVTCDFCHKPITEKWYVDGNTNWGAWATMCPKCFMMNGTGIGRGQGQKYDAVTGRKLQGSDYSELRSRRAMYWGGPERVYRLTKIEQENGNAICPKCKKDMSVEPFTKSDKLYACPSCGFKVPKSKTTTTRITVDVDNEGEVDVDVTTARRGRNSSVARELVAIEFPTQDAYDKYMKDHPDADKSKHRVVEQTREQVDKYLEEHPGESERRTKETPDEVEERLKKQMGDKYKPQKERTEEGKKEWDKRIEEWRKKGRPTAASPVG